MADGIRISQLPTLTSLTDDDVFIINDGNASTTKITYANVKSAISNDVVSVNSVNGQTGNVTIDASSLSVYTTQQVDDQLVAKASNTVVGVVNGSNDLGVFSGSTIPDNSSVRGALQSLELAVEGGDVEDAILSADNTFTGTNTFQGALTASQNGNIIPFYFDDQASFPSASTYHGAVAHSHADGSMFFAHSGGWVELAKASDISAPVDLTDTYILIGANEGDTDLGTFGGSTISDNASVKTALGELETALEGVTTFSGSYNDLSDTPTLGTAAATDATAYATAAQGALADTALQPGDIGVSVQGYDANTVVDANYSTVQTGAAAGATAVQATADAITVTALPIDGTATVDDLAGAINTLTAELAAILNT